MAGFVFPSRKSLPTPTSPALPTRLPVVQDAIPALPMTPPDSEQSTPNLLRSDNPAVDLALQVISTERAGLAYLEHFYQTKPCAQKALSKAINQVVATCRNGGKLVITGVGKSGKIGQKIEATFKSLGIDSTFLYPTDALHGDLGTIKAVRFQHLQLETDLC
jgi:threonine dehydrogenase-like Zn-dependent dehydrogenase